MIIAFSTGMLSVEKPSVVEYRDHALEHPKRPVRKYRLSQQHRMKKLLFHIGLQPGNIAPRSLFLSRSSALDERRGGTAVDRLRQQRQVADESDRVGEGDEEEEVDDRSVERGEDGHGGSP